MSVYSVASTSGTSGSSSTSSTTSASSNGQLTENSFLQLLVAQLKYQDPSNPTDPSTFMSQTAQFTQVQTLDAMQALDQQVYDSSQQTVANSMIGKTVTWTDAAGATASGVVSGVSVGAATPNLTVNGNTVSLSSVTQVSATTSTATASTGTSTSPGS